MTGAPLARQAPVGVSKPAGTVRFSPACEANARWTLDHAAVPIATAVLGRLWRLTGQCGGRCPMRTAMGTDRRAAADRPRRVADPGRGAAARTELARWREEERQRRERRQLERADWRHEHTTEADTL